MVFVTDSALHKTGFFSEPPSIHAGDQYVEGDRNKLPRYKGVQMKVAYPKIGTTPDALFDKTHKPLQEGEPFTDAYRLERKKELEQQQLLKGKKAFVPPSPNKKPTGPGSTIGCLGPIPLGFKAEGTGKEEGGASGGGTARKEPASAALKKNFYTAPSKKGGAGYDFAQRTIGGKAFQYMADEYMSGQRLTREERKNMREKIKKPFNAGGRTNYPAVVGEPVPEGTAAKATSASRDGSPGGEGKGRPSFRPSSPSKKGAAYCTISKVGLDYIPIGVSDAKDGSGDSKLAPFKPGGSMHSKYTRYINVYEAPPIPPPAPVTDYS